MCGVAAPWWLPALSRCGIETVETDDPQIIQPDELVADRSAHQVNAVHLPERAPVDFVDQPLEAGHVTVSVYSLCALGISGHKMGPPLPWINLPVLTIR